MDRVDDRATIKTELLISGGENKYRVDHKLTVDGRPYASVSLVAGDREIYMGTADTITNAYWSIYIPELDSRHKHEFSNVSGVEDGIKWLMQRCDAVLDAYYQKLYAGTNS